MSNSDGYDIYLKLLKEKGVKNADVSRATGVHPATFSDWKKGKSKPKQEKLQKIAQYFNVSIEYLLTGEDQPAHYVDDETAEYAELLKHNKDLRLLFSAAKDSPPEDLKMAHDMLVALKRKERQE